MDEMVFMALAATLGTWFATALGAGVVLFLQSPSPRAYNSMLGFASGVMIAASFWSLLQPAIQRAQLVSAQPPWFVATAGFLLGAVFMWCSDRAVSRARSRAEEPSQQHNQRVSRIMMLVLSITLHNIPEGLAVGVAFGAIKSGDPAPEELMAAVSVAVGVALQNFPEGAAVSLPLRREGFSRRRSFLIGQASALVEPIAGVAGAMLVVHIEQLLPYALSFAAGAMVLVAVHELIPECQRNQSKNPYFATTGIILGFAIMMLLDVMLG